MTVKTRSSIWNANVLTAGAANETSGTTDLSSAYPSLVTITITNGATGPTVGATVSVQVACDSGGTVWGEIFTFTAATTNNLVTRKAYEIPIGAQGLRLVAGGNTAQDVTINADVSVVNAV